MPLRRRWPTGWGGRGSERANQPTRARGAKVAVLSHFQPRTGRRKLATGFLYHCVSDVASLHRIWMVRVRASCLVRIVTVLANPRASAASPQSSNICVSDLAEKKEIWSKRRPRLCLRPGSRGKRQNEASAHTRCRPFHSIKKAGERERDDGGMAWTVEAACHRRPSLAPRSVGRWPGKILSGKTNLNLK